MSNILHKFFNWLMVSSSDPSKVSLTVKGGLTVLAGAIIPALGLVHVQVGSDAINQVIDSISGIVAAILAIVGYLTFLYGFIRKMIATVRGLTVKA